MKDKMTFEEQELQERISQGVEAYLDNFRSPTCGNKRRCDLKREKRFLLCRKLKGIETGISEKEIKKLVKMISLKKYVYGKELGFERESREFKEYLSITVYRQIEDKFPGIRPEWLSQLVSAEVDIYILASKAYGHSLGQKLEKQLIVGILEIDGVGTALTRSYIPGITPIILWAQMENVKSAAELIGIGAVIVASGILLVDLIKSIFTKTGR